MNDFFGLQIPPDDMLWMCFALGLAVILGGAVGLERQLHGHPAGLRTHMLVCVGSTLITLMSVQMHLAYPGSSDPGRIAAQIVVGIGFLGAGAIVREGVTVRGLTTAASIWTTAGIGIAVGTAPRYGELAVLATAVVLFTLWAMQLVDDWIERLSRRVIMLQVRARDTEHATAAVFASIAAHKITIQNAKYEPVEGGKVQGMRMHLRPPANFDKTKFLADLADGTGILSVNLE